MFAIDSHRSARTRMGIVLGGMLCVASAQALGASIGRPPTYANPLDLPYRFALQDNNFSNGISAREAADPTMVVHDGSYWLFASKSGGYWNSKDMLHWDFIEPGEFPTEEYAPTVKVVNGQWVLATSGFGSIYTSDDAAKGHWKKVRGTPYNDPELFVDDDKQLYLFAGSSTDKPITGIKLDASNGFVGIGQDVPLIAGLDPLRHGWEGKGQFDSDEQLRSEKLPPWMEGATMTKHRGTYYLQYAAPATEMKVYADGVYTASSPLGPYRYESYSPISYKPTGFIAAAGHSNLFTDLKGGDWRITTMLVGVNFMFERRLGLFPSGFLANDRESDQLVTNTYLGDYPQLAPGWAKDALKDNLAGWMLQTYRKTATASSTLDKDHGPEKAFDEDIRTWWAASSANPGEWLQVDMGKKVRIDAIQVNFADAKSTAYGRLRDAYRYRLEISDDGSSWRNLTDRSSNERDAPHEYIQLDQPVTARYARITNVHTPAGAVFSLSGLRLFGSGLGKAPAVVQGLKAERQANRRLMKLSWKASPDADFYVVRYGTKPDRLTLNYQVYDANEVTIPGLNTDTPYFVTIDAVNDTAVTKGKKVSRAP